ncbi:uncharacterized protein LOC141660193 [Apium graveolens]|uniref:uncharacterized protein LOC141660193 n=1 Tax=Apium graveolens TaxID=4045 RepID=UPI003D79108F
MYLYLAEAPAAVSSCLIQKKGDKQFPVYYVSHVLWDAETGIPLLKKWHTLSCLLAENFAHISKDTISKYTPISPLRKILHKPDLSERLVNWVVELSQFNITYLPRPSIKGQALADFLIECSAPLVIETLIEDSSQLVHLPPPWLLFVDGSSTLDSSGARVLLISTEGFEIQQSIRFNFPATNNCSELKHF